MFAVILYVLWSSIWRLTCVSHCPDVLWEDARFTARHVLLHWQEAAPQTCVLLRTSRARKDRIVSDQGHRWSVNLDVGASCWWAAVGFPHGASDFAVCVSLLAWSVRMPLARSGAILTLPGGTYHG